MTIAPDPAEITPPHSSAAYARRGLGLWAVIGLCLASLVAGAALAFYAPGWVPEREKPEAVAMQPTPRPLAATATPVITADLPATAPEGDVSGLASRVSALETGQDRTVEAAAAALASALLAEAASTSRPFEKELAAVQQVLPASSDAVALRHLARTGAPTRSALAAEFDDAAASAAIAARDPGEQGGFIDRLSYALANIVTIRRVGSTVGNAPDAVLARAERQVDEGDIDGALATLGALPPGTARAMATWRSRAERRAEIDRHVTSIRASALAGLAQVSRSRT
jgi:hypothetical protein